MAEELKQEVSANAEAASEKATASKVNPVLAWGLIVGELIIVGLCIAIFRYGFLIH